MPDIVALWLKILETPSLVHFWFPNGLFFMKLQAPYWANSASAVELHCMFLSFYQRKKEATVSIASLERSLRSFPFLLFGAPDWELVQTCECLVGCGEELVKIAFSKQEPKLSPLLVLIVWALSSPSPFQFAVKLHLCYKCCHGKLGQSNAFSSINLFYWTCWLETSAYDPLFLHDWPAEPSPGWQRWINSVCRYLNEFFGEKTLLTFLSRLLIPLKSMKVDAFQLSQCLLVK